MGDIEKKPTKMSLEEKAREREKRQVDIRSTNMTIGNLTSNPLSKNKSISARVNASTYSNFKNICRRRGISSNACLNMLITDFVRENKHILDD